MMRKENDLQKRLFRFAVDTIKFLRTLPDSPETRIIRYLKESEELKRS